MKKQMRSFLAALLCCLLLSGQAQAADNTLTAKYTDGRYVLNMEFGQFFDIRNLEFGQPYIKTLRFDNTSGKRIRIGMVDVYNNMEDSRLYECSSLDIKVNGVAVYHGVMNEAHWEAYVEPDASITMEYIYSILEPGHIPDNSWMDAQMESTFVFVGEIIGSGSTSSGHDGGSSGGGPKHAAKLGIDQQKTMPADAESAEGVPAVPPDIIITIPDTGDHSAVGIYLLVIVLSGTGIIVIVAGEKK